jgi:hypothetical protein
MDISKESSVHVFYSLRNKDWQWVSSSKVTRQINTSKESSVHLFYSLRNKDWQCVSSSKITSQINISKQTSIHHCYSLRRKSVPLLVSVIVACKWIDRTAGSMIVFTTIACCFAWGNDVYSSKNHIWNVWFLPWLGSIILFHLNQ